MIQTIGLMIGAYIFTRMLAMMLNPGVHVVARAFAGITMLIDVILVFALLLSGLSGSIPIQQ